MNNGDSVTISVGELIRELTVSDEVNTPVVLKITPGNGQLGHWQDILSADIRISDDEHAPFNILVKDENGQSLRVDGLANKIKYNVADNQYITVQNAIDNINLDYNAATNVLTFKLPTNETKSLVLNSVQLLDEIRYDANTESIVIVYNDIYNQNQRISIPVSDLITEWTVENSNHTVTLTKTRSVEGSDILSANVNVMDKGINDNILEVANNSLYVKGTAENIKYNNTTVKEGIDTLNTKIDSETNRAKEVESNLNTKIDTESATRANAVNIIKTMIGNTTDSSDVNSVYGAIKTESEARIAGDAAIEKLIGTPNDSSFTNTVYGNLKIEEEARKNEVARLEQLVNGLSVRKLDQPSNDNTIVSYALVDVNGIQHGTTIDVLKDKFIQSVQLINNDLVFEFILNDGSLKVITINVSEFLKESEFNHYIEYLEIMSGNILSFFRIK